MFVDSHCHLSFPELKNNLPQIRAAMNEARVERALCICTTMEEFAQVHALALQHENFWCSVGVHPDNEGVHEPSVAELFSAASQAKVVAIGETGLDYYRLNGRSVSEMAWQRERFRVHVHASQRTGLPLVIHTRNASADTLAILKEEGASHGVFHCFTETMEVARQALDMGFFISFSGILTFKNAVDLKEVARWAPLDRCLIETDSPYLAPHPFRGKTNSPALLPHVAQALADLKSCSLEKIAEATSRNFEQLFSRSMDDHEVTQC